MIAHRFCIYSPGLVWAMVLGNALVALAYFGIPIVLTRFILRNHVPFRAVYAMFAVFIVLCGLTHVLDIVVMWWPIYALQTLVIDLTAIASLATLGSLIVIAPTFEALLQRAKELDTTKGD